MANDGYGIISRKRDDGTLEGVVYDEAGVSGRRSLDAVETSRVSDYRSRQQTMTSTYQDPNTGVPFASNGAEALTTQRTYQNDYLTALSTGDIKGAYDARQLAKKHRAANADIFGKLDSINRNIDPSVSARLVGRDWHEVEAQAAYRAQQGDTAIKQSLEILNNDANPQHIRAVTGRGAAASTAVSNGVLGIGTYADAMSLATAGSESDKAASILNDYTSLSKLEERDRNAKTGEWLTSTLNLSKQLENAGQALGSDLPTLATIAKRAGLSGTQLVKLSEEYANTDAADRSEILRSLESAKDADEMFGTVRDFGVGAPQPVAFNTNNAPTARTVQLAGIPVDPVGRGDMQGTQRQKSIAARRVQQYTAEAMRTTDPALRDAALKNKAKATADLSAAVLQEGIVNLAKQNPDMSQEETVVQILGLLKTTVRATTGQDAISDGDALDMLERAGMPVDPTQREAMLNISAARELMRQQAVLSRATAEASPDGVQQFGDLDSMESEMDKRQSFIDMRLSEHAAGKISLDAKTLADYTSEQRALDVYNSTVKNSGPRPLPQSASTMENYARGLGRSALALSPLSHAWSGLKQVRASVIDVMRSPEELRLDAEMKTLRAQALSGDPAAARKAMTRLGDLTGIRTDAAAAAANLADVTAKLDGIRSRTNDLLRDRPDLQAILIEGSRPPRAPAPAPISEAERLKLLDNAARKYEADAKNVGGRDANAANVVVAGIEAGAQEKVAGIEAGANIFGSQADIEGKRIEAGADVEGKRIEAGANIFGSQADIEGKRIEAGAANYKTNVEASIAEKKIVRDLIIARGINETKLAESKVENFYRMYEADKRAHSAEYATDASVQVATLAVKAGMSRDKAFVLVNAYKAQLQAQTAGDKASAAAAASGAPEPTRSVIPEFRSVLEVWLSEGVPGVLSMSHNVAALASTTPPPPKKLPNK